MVGRKPTPTGLKILRLSSKRADKLIRKQIPVAGNLFDPPPGLSPEQKVGWAYAIENAPKDVLKKIDRGILAGYIIAEDIHRQATDEVNRMGLLVSSPNGHPIQNPYLPIVNKQMALMIRAADQLGFTPCSRARIESGLIPALPDNGWDEVAS